METAWVALAQLCLYLYMNRGSSHAACVLWRPLAQNGIRQLFVSAVSRYRM